MDSTSNNQFIYNCLVKLIRWDENTLIDISTKTNIHADIVNKWFSGKHDFSLNEVVQIENYLQVSILSITPTSILENIVRLDTPLEYLVNKKLITERSKRLCNSAKLFTINELLLFYKKHHSFLPIRGCGSRNNEELKKYCSTVIPRIPIKNAPEVVKPFFHGTPQEFNSIAEPVLSSLSVRSQNAIKNIYYESKDHIDFVQKLFAIEEDPAILPNIGRKSVSDILTFISHLKSYSDSKIKPIADNNFIENIIQSKVKKTFKLEESASKVIAVNILSNKNFIFNLLWYIINNSGYYAGNSKIIFNEYCQNTGITLSDMADRLHISRERVRQLKMKLFTEITKLTEVIIKLFQDNSPNYEYNLIGTNDYIFITTDFANNINENELCNFSNEIISHVLKEIKGTDFTRIPFDNGNSLVINYKFASNYKIDKFKYYLENILSNKRMFNENISIYEILHSTLVESKSNITDEVLIFFKRYLEHGFDIILNDKDEIAFQSNKELSLEKIALIVLESIGSPSNLKQIELYISTHYPEKIYASETLRRILQTGDKFISFSRTSTYGLKTWENDKENIKGGTIVDMVYDLLKSRAIPLHISDITSYVKNYRKTNSKNISTNLKLDTKSRFINFGSEFFGIVDMKYSPEMLVTEPISNKLYKYVSEKIMNDGPQTIEGIKRFIRKHQNLHESQINHFIQESLDKKKLVIDENKIYLPNWKYL